MLIISIFLGENISAIRKSMEAVVHTSEEVGLEINAEKTKYIFMSRYQTTGQNHNIRVTDISFESVTNFKYLGIIVTNQNNIHDEINTD
jgi:hypothetical protein